MRFHRSARVDLAVARAQIVRGVSGILLEADADQIGIKRERPQGGVGAVIVAARLVVRMGPRDQVRARLRRGDVVGIGVLVEELALPQ